MLEEHRAHLERHVTVLRAQLEGEVQKVTKDRSRKSDGAKNALAGE